MGEGYSKEKASSDRGSIYVQTDKPFYYSGDVVTGNIFLHLVNAYPARFIDIQVKGKEKTKIKEIVYQTDEEGKMQTKTKKHKDDHKILFTRLPIAHFDQGYIPAGQYRYPFTFQLANDLPSSIILTDHMYKAKVNYSIKAILEPVDDSGVKKMKFKQRLIVREKSYGVGYGQLKEDSGKVTSCCCIGKGELTMKGSFEKNFYTAEETAKASAWIDNTKCKADVVNIALELKMLVDLKADHHHISRCNVLASQEFPGVAKGETTGEDPRHLELDLNTINVHALPRKKKEWSAQDEFLANKAPANCDSKLAKVRYILEISPKLDIMCCSDSPSIQLPMFLLPPQLPMFNQVDVPAGWEPQVYDNYQFSLQNQSFVPKGQLPTYYQQGAPVPQPLPHHEPVAFPGSQAPAYPINQPQVEMSEQASGQPLSGQEQYDS